MKEFTIRILSAPEEMWALENIQRQVWGGNDTEIVPAHLLLAASHNGGLVIGAYASLPKDKPETHPPSPADLIGFVFSFPALDFVAGKAVPKHQSHMLAVLTPYREKGVGFLLKRAQWQMVRHQGLERISWTYDPLLSRNAYLNIAKLGAVCNTYLRDEYGKLRDELNAGDNTDRFQVDWWVNSTRVERRLSRRARLALDLAHYLEAGVEILNRTHIDEQNHPVPDDPPDLASLRARLLLVEIPADYPSVRVEDPALARRWRLHFRGLCEGLFGRGYLATDFLHMGGEFPRSFYVFSNGEATFT